MSYAEIEWTGAHLSEPWQGIRYLELSQGGQRLIVHMAHVVELEFQRTDVRVRGSEPISYEVSLPHASPNPGQLDDEIHVDFSLTTEKRRGTWTVEIGAPAGVLLHPFFASAQFVFAIACETGDCRPAMPAAAREPGPEPAIDLRAKDFRGLLGLLVEHIRVGNRQWADLSPASLERCLVELLAHHGDMLSYYQDRVANEAFLETASQRFSLAQHALLLGERLDEHRAATTLLAFDGMAQSGEIPAGLQVRTARRSGELSAVFTVLSTLPVDPANDVDQLVVAQWSGAFTAAIPVGATSLLLLGSGEGLHAGRQLALVQASQTQVRTIVGLETIEAAGWVADPNLPLSLEPVELFRVRFDRPLDQALALWSSDPELRLRVHGNLVPAAHGTRVRAVLPSPTTGALAREDLPIRLGRRDAVIVPDPLGELGYQLRAVRLPIGPLLWDLGSDGELAPALQLEIDGQPWHRQDHLHRSRSHDNHYLVTSDDDGRAWLHFGDGRRGKAVIVHPDPELGLAAAKSELELIVRFRVGDPTTGNVALAKLREIIPPRSDEVDLQSALAQLGPVRVTNVLPASGGAPHGERAAIREHLPSALRYGPLRRAVTLADYARVAEQSDERVERAAARLIGGAFNTVLVLVDQRESEQLSDELRARVDSHLQALRMTGREVLVRGPEYVPFDVELVVCPQPGVALHHLRDRIYAVLRPGSSERPGFFHPDRLSFGHDLELGELLAYVQVQTGVRSVKALRFRPLREPGDAQVFTRVRFGATEVARLDADEQHPENGRLRVKVVGLDADIDLDAWSIDQPATVELQP